MCFRASSHAFHLPMFLVISRMCTNDSLLVATWLHLSWATLRLPLRMTGTALAAHSHLHPHLLSPSGMSMQRNMQVSHEDRARPCVPGKSSCQKRADDATDGGRATAVSILPTSWDDPIQSSPGRLQLCFFGASLAHRESVVAVECGWRLAAPG